MNPRGLRWPSARPVALLIALLAGGAVRAAADDVDEILDDDAESPPSSAPMTVLGRTIVQDQGGWQVDYRIRHDGATGLVVTPGEIAGRVEGWVSNSRVASHAVPRPSTIALSGPTGLSASADVIAAADELQRCRERLTVQVWTGDDPEPTPAPAPTPRPAGQGQGQATAAAPPGAPILSIAPGALVRVRLRLEHQHFLYGDYDPLLGQRDVELRLGALVLRDLVPMEREHYLAQPKYAWPQPPEDRRDTRHFVSAPDSLHLEAHVPGNQYYRFPERPVRYGTTMRLRFSYLVAAGTEGECRARVAQYKDTPTAWKNLPDGSIELPLAVVGRWTRVERIFRTECDATTLALDFNIGGGSEVGEIWIDDVALEPVAGPSAEP